MVESAILDHAVDLGVADMDATLRHALAQALHDQLLAYAFAKLLEVLPLLSDGAAQLADFHVVLLGDLRKRLIHFRIGDLDAGRVGARHLQLLQHQAIKQLAFEHIARRQLLRIFRKLRRHTADVAIEFALQHNVLVDDGDDAVQRQRGNRLRTRYRRNEQGQGQGNEE